MEKLTVAISIQCDGKAIGPHNGCPILYVYNSDHPDYDAFNALLSEEFYEYLEKNNCFVNVHNYFNTKIRVTYYTKEKKVEYINTTLQDTWTFDYLKEDKNKAPNLAWVCVYNAILYIWKASFPDENFPLTYGGDLHTPESYNEIVRIYNKLLDKFGDKLNHETFVQSVRSWLQRREMVDLANLTDFNISYIEDKIRGIIGTEQG